MSPKRVKAKMASSNTPHIDSPEFKTDEFRMYGLKVVDCPHRYSHDWTTCPFAHPGEKARRRDPRRFNYFGIACPNIKQSNNCPLQENCFYAHNVFEYWLHPTRYRTQLCNIAASCNRTVCFFAHTIDELRVPPPVDPGSELVNSLVQMTQQPLNPFARSSSEFEGVFGAQRAQELPLPGVMIDAHANNVLQQWIARRQLASAQYSMGSSSVNDFNEIQTLFSLLQQQQNMAGLSERNRDLNLAFLNALLQSLSRAVGSAAIQIAEKERLTKLIDWMRVQLIQNRQSPFSATDVAMPFSMQQAEMPSNTVLPPVEALNLSRIPETTATISVPLPALQRTSHDSALQLTVSSAFPTLAPDPRLQNPFTRPTSLDSRSPVHGRWYPPGSSMRMSDESTVTWMSAQRTSGTFSLVRSSADSESYNRRSLHAITGESPTISREDSSQVPDFICHDTFLNRNPPPPPPGSSA